MGSYSKRTRIWRNVFISTTAVFFILTIILGSLVFLNWDYISFKALMTQRYLRGDILDALIEEKVDVEADGRHMLYFDNLAIAAVTDLIRETGMDPYTYQDNPAQYASYTSWREDKAAKSHIKELTADTVYMLLTNFTPATMEFFDSKIPEISSYENLVLDLRNNSGGDINVIFRMADYFLEDGTVMMVETRKHTTTDIRAKNPKELSFRRIIILQDKRTASASEQLITSLGENLDTVTTVGSPTYGKYVGQTRIPLLRDFYVKATTLEWVAPDGRPQPEGGIEPDYEYEGDDILDYVLSDIIK